MRIACTRQTFGAHWQKKKDSSTRKGVFLNENKYGLVASILKKLVFHFLSNWMEYDRGDSFPFDCEPNGMPLGSKSKGKRKSDFLMDTQDSFSPSVKQRQSVHCYILLFQIYLEIYTANIVFKKIFLPKYLWLFFVTRIIMTSLNSPFSGQSPCVWKLYAFIYLKISIVTLANQKVMDIPLHYISLPYLII